MGVIFKFYGLTSDKMEQYHHLIAQKIEDYELLDWLEEHSSIPDTYLSISYSSMDEISEWLCEFSKSIYSPDDGFFYEIEKSEAAKQAFFELYWMKEHWLNPDDIWGKSDFLIILKQY